MAQTQIADVVVPVEFTDYVVINSVVSTAFSQSGVLVQNGVIQEQLAAGAQSFTVPAWLDLDNIEPNYSTDSPTDIAVPKKMTSVSQVIRKTFANSSWSSMDLASELAGSEPLKALENRVTSYWDRQMEYRLIASLNGVLASNIANSSSDMVLDISGNSGAAAQFGATAVINAAATLGDAMNVVKAIAMHSHIYTQALINDEIQFVANSQGVPFKTYRGLAVIVDDNLMYGSKYVTVLFGNGAVGYGLSAPETGFGTEVYRAPASGNGGGQTTLYSRLNMAVAPVGFSWNDGTGANAIVGLSPNLAALANAAHWTRIVPSRKSIPLAFLITQ